MQTSETYLQKETMENVLKKKTENMNKPLKFVGPEVDLETLDEPLFDDLQDVIDHGILVSNLASRLAKELHCDAGFCSNIAMAGLLHDIGKLKLDSYIYGKGSSLSVEQMRYVRMHPTLGYEILNEDGDYDEEVLMAVFHHHENFDGSGYPSNLKGTDIPYMARILRVCDVFAALISERLYRAAFDIKTAVELMIDEVKNFDMSVFLAFLSVINSEQIDDLQEYVNEVNSKFIARGTRTA